MKASMRGIVLLLVISIFCFNCKNYSKSNTNSEMKVIDKDFGKKYAIAWSGQNAVAFSKFFAPTGSLKVNDKSPAVGREAIATVAQSYMTAFPDMVVALDSFPITPKGAEFHWTLTGTNTGPNGTGNTVRVSGVERLKFDADGLITESIGSFDEKEYHRQLNLK